MGFKNFISKQFLDVIQWNDETQNTLVYQFPMEDNEIQSGGVLIVGPGQAAVFVENGQVADVFTEGRYKLTTENLPILGNLKHWAFKFESSFKAQVYFINLKQFINLKWGTPHPIQVRDEVFETVQIGAFGTFGFKIAEPKMFVQSISSTNKVYTVEMIHNQLRSFIVANLAAKIREQKVSTIDISEKYPVIGEALTESVKDEFAALGLEMCVFTVENVNLPKELQEQLNKRTSFNILGGFNNYTQLETLEVMKEAAKNPSANTFAQTGIGFGMGMQMGNMMMGNMQNMQNPQSTQQPTPAQAPAPGENTHKCAKCGLPLQQGAKFCMECGEKVQDAPKKKFCPECGVEISLTAKFCPECGHKFE